MLRLYLAASIDLSEDSLPSHKDLKYTTYVYRFHSSHPVLLFPRPCQIYVTTALVSTRLSTIDETTLKNSLTSLDNAHTRYYSDGLAGVLLLLSVLEAYLRREMRPFVYCQHRSVYLHPCLLALLLPLACIKYTYNIV